MNSGVAKVNPESPSVSSNQVCKCCKNTCGPRVVAVGSLSRADWDQKSQKCHSQNTNWVNLCLREQQQNQLASQGCEKLWICSVSKKRAQFGVQICSVKWLSNN